MATAGARFNTNVGLGVAVEFCVVSAFPFYSKQFNKAIIDLEVSKSVKTSLTWFHFLTPPIYTYAWGREYLCAAYNWLTWHSFW